MDLKSPIVWALTLFLVGLIAVPINIMELALLNMLNIHNAWMTMITWFVTDGLAFLIFFGLSIRLFSNAEDNRRSEYSG